MNYHTFFFPTNFSPSNRLEVGPVARLDSTRRGRDNFSSVWGKNLHADTETKFRTEPPIFAIFFLLDKFSIRFMVSDPRIRIERKKLSSKRGGYEDRCGRIARFLWSFFSFFYDRAARGIHIVSRRVHSWWDAFQRIVSFSLYSPLFSFVFSLFLFFLSFFFFSAARCPRALDRSFWLWQRCRPLSISRMKTRKSRSNLAIGRCLSLLILSPAGNWRKAIFTGGGEREREVTCLETTRWNAIRERGL